MSSPTVTESDINERALMPVKLYAAIEYALKTAPEIFTNHEGVRELQQSLRPFVPVAANEQLSITQLASEVRTGAGDEK